VNWPRYTLDQLGFVGRGRSKHRPRNDPRLYGGEYPFIQTADIQAAHMNIRGYSQTYNAEGLAQSKLWDKPTLCITIAGENTASTAILTFPACFPDSIVGFVPDLGKANIKFVKHALDMMRRQFRSVSKGATQDNLSIAKILSFPFPVPSLTTQERIASIIAAYDDLIENNLRRIGLLEKAARLLYREWFINFRFPGHEHVKMVDGLPEGWKRQQFREVCEAVGGGTPATAKSEYWSDGDIPWFTPTDITRNACLALLDSEKKITDAGLQHSSAKMLPAGTVLMTSRASVGFFGIIDAPSCTNQGFISIVPHDPQARMYLLHNLMHRVEEIRSHAGGTTYKEISKGKFKGLPSILPEALLLREFEEQASEMHSQVRTLHTMNQKLAQARDLLLPRLMNGQIAV
jgi:type I restriction enzyme S subunit